MRRGVLFSLLTEDEAELRQQLALLLVGLGVWIAWRAMRNAGEALGFVAMFGLLWLGADGGG